MSVAPVGAVVVAASVAESVGWGEAQSASGSDVGDPASSRSAPRLSPTNNTQASTTVLSDRVSSCYISVI